MTAVVEEMGASTGLPSLDAGWSQPPLPATPPCQTELGSLKLAVGDLQQRTDGSSRGRQAEAVDTLSSMLRVRARMQDAARTLEASRAACLGCFLGGLGLCAWRSTSLVCARGVSAVGIVHRALQRLGSCAGRSSGWDREHGVPAAGSMKPIGAPRNSTHSRNPAGGQRAGHAVPRRGLAV